MFLRRIWRGKPISENSWAIEQDPDPLEKASWSVVGHVELLAARLPEYVNALRSTLADWRGARLTFRLPCSTQGPPRLNPVT